MADSIAVQRLSSASCFAGRWLQQQQQQQQQPKSSPALVRWRLRAPQVYLRAAVVKCKVPIEELSPKEQRFLRKKEAQKKLRKIRKERRARRTAEELAKIPRVVPNPALKQFQQPFLAWNKPWKKKSAVDSKQPTERLGFQEPREWSEFEAAYDRARMTCPPDRMAGRNLDGNSVQTREDLRDASTTSRWERNEFEGVDSQSSGGDDSMIAAAGESVNSDMGTKETASHSSMSEFNARTGARTAISGEIDGGRQGTGRRRGDSWSGAGTPQDSGQALNERDQLGGSISAGRDVEIPKFWNAREMYLDDRLDEKSLEEEAESRADDKEPKMGERRAAPNAGVARVIIGRRKGENVYLSTGDDDAVPVKGLPRSDLDEGKQLEWLAQQLNTLGRPDGVHFSKLMRSGGLKITDGRAVTLVQRLGELGNWRCAMQVVEWLHTRKQYPPLRSRYVFTTLLAILGRARRPSESRDVFNVMREHADTYPDMPAYQIIAVTLGQAGALEESLKLIQSLQQGAGKNTKYIRTVPDQGKLHPDVVVYNAALNSCVPHRHWRCALRILGELHKGESLRPNSASYGLVIEVLVKAGKFDVAWDILNRMESGGFQPNSSTYKAVVEGLGQVGNPDLAVEMVKQMEDRGISAAPGVYYQLAKVLCKFGRWEDALLQVDRITGMTERPTVQTLTGLLVACKKAGHWRDAISIYKHMQEVCAPNIGTYNIMISLYGSNNMYDEAKRLFDQLKKGRLSPRKLYQQDPVISPDMFTYDAMLGSCTLSEKWEDAQVIFQEMLMQGYQLSGVRHGWIFRAVSEAGKGDLLTAMFDNLRSSNAATSEFYVPMIQSCLHSNEHDTALSYLKEMYRKDVKINSLDFQKLKEFARHLSEDSRSTFLRTVDGVKVTTKFRKPTQLQRAPLQPRATTRKTSDEFPTISCDARKSNVRNYNGEDFLNGCSSLNGSLDGAAHPVLSKGDSGSLSEDYASSGDQAWQLRTPQSRPLDMDSATSSKSALGWELLWKGSSLWQRTHEIPEFPKGDLKLI